MNVRNWSEWKWLDGVDKLRAFMVRSWCDPGHSWYGVSVTAYIHGTELMWPRAFMVRSWCDSAKSFHVVPVYTVQWQFIWRIFSFLSFINDEKIHQISYIRTQPSTLRSWCNLVKWPYGVKKISIKWLLPVKVTLEVIKRHPKVFCWSCDEDPLKLDKKKLRSFQFVITDRMSLLSPLSSNGRSIPLRWH
jgi:hypothetical protein